MGIYFRDILLIRISRGANNCGQHSLEKNIYFIMRFSPHFQLFYFNDRLEFCEFFEWKIKRINNADLFSQPPLLIFIKGANIGGGHHAYIHTYIHTHIHTYIHGRHWGGGMGGGQGGQLPPLISSVMESLISAQAWLYGVLDGAKYPQTKANTIKRSGKLSNVFAHTCSVEQWIQSKTYLLISSDAM